MKPADHPTPVEHPGDDRLLAQYFDPAAPDEALELHLFRCGACAARRDELAATLDADHDRTLAASDAYFTASRLSRQRAAILDRIAHPPHARVLRFPGTSPARPVLARVVRTYTRWTAAAAVLVLSVGAGSGWLWDGRQQAPRAADVVQASALIVAQAAEPDDTVLSEIDLALARPQTAELVALDALTPRAGEQPINP